MELNIECMHAVIGNVIKNTTIFSNCSAMCGITVSELSSALSTQFDSKTVSYAILKLKELKFIVLDNSPKGWDEKSKINDVTYEGHIWYQNQK